ncbi:response regulator [Methanoregula sp.]|uniref:response regulator n=1 Tax=Methanoregula sp. TaxID=2052170 RepID=UPI002C54723A|nr:response regulator [Methanoregula sp.]HVP96779.1 response regulator [Methanoregula sp.]
MPKARILIVEDELIVAEDLSTTLSSLGHEVVGIAGSGERAIELADEKNPEVILMDIMLSGKLDGIATANTIHAKHDIPVIYVTAYADEALIARAKKTEPFGYIVKPFNEREVQSNIEIALYRHKMEQDIKKRDAILFAVGSGIEWFLREFASSHKILPGKSANTSRPPGYYPILESIGSAMNLYRIAVFRYDTHDAKTMTLNGEWTSTGSASLINAPHVEKIDPIRFGLASRLAELKQGRPVIIRIDDFDSAMKKIFASYRFASMAVFEIQVHEEPYGLVFFIDKEDRSWPSEEIEAMRIATNILGSAMGLSAKND